jgi:isocitrate dehydrogenase
MLSKLVKNFARGAQLRVTSKAGFTFQKIKMDNPVVDLDGDEQTRIIWKQISKSLSE